MGIVYCGPFAAEINEFTPSGHEGYAAQVLTDGTESPHCVSEFREYRAGCDCGWRSSVAHPPTAAGEAAAEDEWNDKHLQPLIQAVVARWVVPVSEVLDLIAMVRCGLAAAAVRPDGGLTARELGRGDVIETLEFWLESAAVDTAVERSGRSAGSAR